MRDINAMDYVVIELKKIMANIVVYYANEFKKYETVQTKKDYHYYRRALVKEDSFLTYPTYDPNLLMDWGIATTIEDAVRMGDNPREEIPQSLWGLVLMNYRKHLIDNYVEGNEYVRYHIGLPPLGVPGHYASDEFYTDNYIDKTYVHLLSDNDVVRLVRSGELDKMKSQYPDMKYLSFIGAEKIDHHVMKTAWNFEIIKLDVDVDPILLSKFTTMYLQNREYVANILYVQDYSKRYQHYDRFMAMLVLIMTIQRVTVDIFKVGIDRDFYDLATLEMFFEQYNVPFLSDLPLDYLRLFAKNMNKLLHYKSTDKVLYDVASLLGLDNVEIFKYFLVKQQRYDDETGNPLFLFKDGFDDDGNPIKKFDYEMMFDVYFQTVDIRDPNPMLALTNPVNRLEYYDVVTDDPYWWFEEKDLQKVMYEHEYNYIETKYIHMNIMYRLTEMMFEVIHFFRMLLDKKDNTRTINIALPKISSQFSLSYFETAVFMICLICKRNNMRGEIISEPSKIMSVLGFNFAADFDYIRQLLEENKNLIDSNRIASYIMDMEVNSKQDIERLYANIRDLWEFLVEQMADTDNIRAYEIYEKIYRTLHVTKDATEVFRMKDGTIASTYFEYLEELNPRLHFIIETTPEKQIPNLIDHIVYRLQDEITELEHLHILNDGSGSIIDALKIMIRFFKSYTVDMKRFNIIYLMDSRYFNMVKIIDHIQAMHADITLGDEHLVDEMIHSVFLYVDHYFKGKIPLNELYSLYAKIWLKDKINLVFKPFIEAKMSLGTDPNIIDHETIYGTIFTDLDLKLQERYDIDLKMLIKEYLNLVNKALYEVSSSYSDLNHMYHHQEILGEISTDLDINYDHVIDIKMKHSLDETINLLNKIAIYGENAVATIINIVDDINVDSFIENKSTILLAESLKMSSRLKYEDKFMSDEFKTFVEAVVMTNHNLLDITDLKSQLLVYSRDEDLLRDTYFKYTGVSIQHDVLISIRHTINSLVGVSSAVAIESMTSMENNITGSNTMKYDSRTKVQQQDNLSDAMNTSSKSSTDINMNQSSNSNVVDIINSETKDSKLSSICMRSTITIISSED